MPYLSDLINDHKAIRNESNEWKIQLNMSVNFISSNDTGEIRTFLCGVIMKKLGRVMKQMTLLKDFLNNFQKEETTMTNGSGFVFESVDLLSYHVHKTSLKRGKSYTKSPEWVINKRATIKPKNKDNKSFQFYNCCIKPSKH